MISWIFISMALVIAIICLCTEDTECYLCSGLIILILSITIGHAYFNDFIVIPEEYKSVENKIVKIQEIITDKTLVMSEVELKRDLSKLISEKEDWMKTIRINNKSPFALFKIELEN